MPLKPMPATYDGMADMWILDVETVLPDHVLSKAVEFIYKANEGRRSDMHSIDAKQHLEKALSALRRGRIQQRLSGKGDQVLFQSTERATSRVFSFGGE